MQPSLALISVRARPFAALEHNGIDPGVEIEQPPLRAVPNLSALGSLEI